MLIKGDIIPSNKKRVIKLLEKYLSNDKSDYFYLYGSYTKKKENMKKQRISLKNRLKKEILNQYMNVAKCV